MKYCVFTVVMGEYPVEDVARELKGLGYDGIEWRVHDDYHISVAEIKQKAAEVRALTEARGLEIPALGAYLNPADIEQVETVFRAARAMNCPAVRIGSARYDGNAPYDQLLNEATDHLKRVERLSREIGVKALLETHSGTIIPSASAAYRLVSRFDPQHVGVIFDPANMILEGRENWQMGLEILSGYIAHVHVKNLCWLKREDDGGMRWEWEYTPLDKGMVHWREAITALRAVAYDGYLSIEDLHGGKLATTGLIQESLPSQDVPEMPILEMLEKDLDYLKTVG